MKKYEMVEYFLKNYTALVQSMEDTKHYVNLETPNIYHAEGSVLTHTMCVLSTIDFLTEDPEERIPLYLAALLHDIGKPYTIELRPATDTKPKRYAFFNHEAYSVFYCIEILKDFQKAFTLSDEVIKKVITVIGLHGTALSENMYAPDDIQRLRELFRKADKGGAVRTSEVSGVSGVEDDYEKRNFNHKTPDIGKEIVFLIGLPNSGKSTLIAEQYKDYYVVSRDNEICNYYVEVMGNQETNYNDMYNAIHKDEMQKQKFDQYFDQKVIEAKVFDKIVIDMTMLTLKGRRKMLANFSKHKPRAVLLVPSIDTISTREVIRAEMGKAIPEFVYKNMMKSFSFPTYEEFTNIEIVYKVQTC